MRANDRTLLASLGFSDPDKVSERHDLGCRYLLHPEMAKKLGTSVITAAAQRKCPEATVEITAISGRVEVPISKGEGQYKTTIGFLDVVLTGEAKVKPLYLDPGRFEIHVEVKVGVVPVSAILRQIKLYREFRIPTSFALVTDFPLSDSEMNLLKNERIHAFRFGPDFDAFCESQRGEKTAVVPEL
jgi:hypothetical protein